MNRNKLLMICVAAFMLIAAGTVVLSSYSTVTRSAVTFDQTLIVPGGNYGSKLFDVFRNYDYIVSFTVLNGSLRSCFPLAEGYFDQWQNGEYEPNWGDETSHAEYQIRRSGPCPEPQGQFCCTFLSSTTRTCPQKRLEFKQHGIGMR